MEFENRRYVIINVDELHMVDFSEVLQTSAETSIKSLDGTKTIIKYEGPQPISVVGIPSRSREYSHEEILQILSSAEWSMESQGD